MSHGPFIKARMHGGGEIVFHSEPLASGGEKVVFKSQEGKHVVGFFFGQLDDRPERLRRLEKIIGSYNPTTGGAQAEHWLKHFCWPVGVVDGTQNKLPAEWLRRNNLHAPVLGVVAPVYRANFFFRDRTGELREKKGKWFTGVKARKLLPDSEKGDFLRYLQVCSVMASAVRRLHYAGLAHADLSHNNVLIDPKGGDACVIDIDSLVVPGLAPPTVLGTPGYIAPEVVAGKKLPSIETDQHALAVLLYETLLQRHPLHGPKIHTTRSAEEDDLLMMGARALYIEHPTDFSNHPKTPPAISVRRLGPYLEKLFLKTFAEGLHQPARRATATEWEKALSKTFDLLHPSPAGGEWFVLDRNLPMICPHSGQRLTQPVPYVDFYRETSTGAYSDENHSLTLWNGLHLYKWHTLANVSPHDAERTSQGYFTFHNRRWYLVNQSGADMWLPDAQRFVPHGAAEPITQGLKVLFSLEEGRRLGIFNFMKP
ncbi:kinase [Verrucomicrobiota bacterium]|nr:kinase [Verrucomicrobiota bacterium]